MATNLNVNRRGAPGSGCQASTFSQKMDGTPDLQKHPTFHRNSMIVAFLLGALVFTFGGVSIYAEKHGDENPIPAWLIVSMIVALIGWMLYRALLARPHCPSCRCKDTQRMADYSEEVKGAKNPENWRRYRCASCGDEFLIPGLSLDG